MLSFKFKISFLQLQFNLSEKILLCIRLDVTKVAMHLKIPYRQISQLITIYINIVPSDDARNFLHDYLLH